MTKRYVSEKLLNEMPRSLTDFIWYLWEVYCDPDAKESRFLLQSDGNGQRVTIPLIDKTVVQDFGTAFNTVILIRKCGSKYYMSQQY